MGIVNGFAVHFAQLGHPLANVFAVGVKLLALEQRVKDAKVRLRIDPSRRREAPATIVGGKVAVDEMLHEIPLTHAPVDQQVLGQERGDDHPASVVHVAHVVELAHGGVDNGEARLAVTPGLEELHVILPSDVCVLWLERLVHAGAKLRQHLRTDWRTITYQTYGQRARTCL